MDEVQEPVEFIEKLLKMMQNHPAIITWNDNQTEIVIRDLKKMAEVVIPVYFRHAKYESFVRQLNMYNFHKVCREKNNTINFKHDLFYKGNEHNYFKIKRKKKIQGKCEVQNSEDQIQFIQTHPTLPNHLKDLIVKLINYKAQAIAHNSRLKSFFLEVGNDLRTPKFRKFDKEISEVKSIIENIYERSETIDELFPSSKKPPTESPLHHYQSYQEKLDEALGSQHIKSTIVGLCDYNPQVSMQGLPEKNIFPIFKTKVNFIDVLPDPEQRWRDDDRLSACSIQYDLDE